MLNAEKYRSQVLDIIEEGRQGRQFAVSKDRQNIVRSCVSIKCETCIFNEEEKYGYGCDYSRIRWLLSEHNKEPIKLTRFEFEMLKWLDKGGYKFIIRSPNNNLIAHDDTPKKILNEWISESRYKTLAFDELLHFIKCEDEEPTSIQGVLKNCEVMDDDTDKRQE